MEQWRLAEKVGCSVSAIKRIERGEKGGLQLGELLALKISAVTGVDHRCLLENDLTRPLRNCNAQPYSKFDYELAQAETWLSFSSSHVKEFVDEQSRRLTEILCAVRSDGIKMKVACYRVRAFLDELTMLTSADAAAPTTKLAKSPRHRVGIKNEHAPDGLRHQRIPSARKRSSSTRVKTR